jgi:endonuclease-3 related protein
MGKSRYKLNEIYEKLLDAYSYQGWWPIINYKGEIPNKKGSIKGYHPNDYDFPRDNNEQFEIIIGTILTQNTSWLSVEKSLNNLNKIIDFTEGNLSLKFKELLETEEDLVKNAIKPAGYYNQKFVYLKNITDFYISLDGRKPGRSEVLSVKGVGNETADSILLYAYGMHEFVVDTYTRRIFVNLNYIDKKDSYIKIKKFFQHNFNGGVNEYQEFHGLIVEHAKHYYSKKPYGVDDKLLEEYKLI